MKLRIYKNKSTVLFIPSNLLTITNKYQNVTINNVPFKATIFFRNQMTKNGSISKSGRLVIPKQIAEYLKLKNKQEVEMEIK